MITHGLNARILGFLALGIAILIALPLVVKSSFAIDIFIRILLFSFIGTAWNLMGGYAKQLSLGHAAYFGLGAYTSTLLEINYNVSPWLGMIAGGVVAVLASLPIGWLCFRLRGPYFTIATIATAQALMLIFLKFRDFAWGAEGTTIPNLGAAPLMMQFENKNSYYYVVLGLLLLGLVITWLIERSWVGYYLVAIGEDEDAALFQEVISKLNESELKRMASLLTSKYDHYFLKIARNKNGSHRLRKLLGISDDVDTFFFAASSAASSTS